MVGGEGGISHNDLTCRITIYTHVPTQRGLHEPSWSVFQSAAGGYGRTFVSARLYYIEPPLDEITLN